jgi:hypothetical protein
MSEFKFACPVCGQHITADSQASGSHLECPTCFQSIVVPQAPASNDSKFILSASKVSKRRHSAPLTDTTSLPVRRSLASRLVPVLVGVVLLALAAGAAVVVIKKQLFKPHPVQALAPTNSPPAPAVAAERTVYPIPTNFTWTLNLTNVSIPKAAPAGSVHGLGFHCERVTFQGGPQGGNLSFRQGKAWPPDLGLTILLFARQAEELSGKTLDVSVERPPPLPRLILRWKDDQQQAVKAEFQSGYALKLAFGSITNNRIPGQIYVSLPDDQKSFLAGTFAAEIRKPNPPKNKKGPPRPIAQNPK